MKSGEIRNFATNIIDWKRIGVPIDAFYYAHADLFSGNVIEVGCGDNICHSVELDKCRYFGIDLSLPALFKNTWIDYKICADVACLPIRDACADLVVSKDMIEHLPDPGAFLKEVSRVLNRKGRAIIATPNLWGWTQVSLMSRFLPSRVASLVCRILRQSDLPAWQFVYKANTARAFRRLGSDCGLEVESILYINLVTGWLGCIPILYNMAYVYGELLGRIRFDSLQSYMIVVLKQA